MAYSIRTRTARSGLNNSLMAQTTASARILRPGDGNAGLEWKADVRNKQAAARLR